VHQYYKSNIEQHQTVREGSLKTALGSINTIGTSLGITRLLGMKCLVRHGMGVFAREEGGVGIR
jgi:hypothetical protein